MDAWLQCEVSAGQFETEAAIRGTDFNGEAFSLFVPARCVKPPVSSLGPNEWSRGKLQVEILDTREGNNLVELPGQTFGNGQTITVREAQLERIQPAQPA